MNNESNNATVFSPCVFICMQASRIKLGSSTVRLASYGPSTLRPGGTHWLWVVYGAAHVHKARPRPLLFTLDDMAARSNDRVGVCSSRMILSALEPGRTVAPNGTIRTTVDCWGRQAVMTRRLVIVPFEYEFDRLN
jgi:hypothetical protein